jgi:hypothetical protein
LKMINHYHLIVEENQILRKRIISIYEYILNEFSFTYYHDENV